MFPQNNAAYKELTAVRKFTSGVYSDRTPGHQLFHLMVTLVDEGQLFHWALVMQKCVSDLGQHWLR